MERNSPGTDICGEHLKLPVRNPHGHRQVEWEAGSTPSIGIHGNSSEFTQAGQ